MNSIVIGSGFGGIAAALRLKAKRHEVKLIEKHPDLGRNNNRSLVRFSRIVVAILMNFFY
mgnify:CR=1 FL=1